MAQCAWSIQCISSGLAMCAGRGREADQLKRFRRYYIYPRFWSLTPYRTSLTASVNVYYKHHLEFFANVSRFLNPNGVILREESSAGSTVGTFQNMIDEAGLEVLFVQGSQGKITSHTGIYWIGIKRAGDTTPPWAIQL
jgi:hypothetical protein